MPMFGSGNKNGLDRFVFKQGAMVAVRLWGEALNGLCIRLRAFQIRLKDIGYGAYFKRGVLLENRHDERAASTSADHAKGDLVGRRGGVGCGARE